MVMSGPAVGFRTLFAILVASMTVGACKDDSRFESQAGEYLNWSSEATFVGKEVCGECHKENYESYIRSQMGRSYKKASYSNSDADWDNPDPVYDPTLDLWYQPFRRGEDLFVKEYRLRDGDTTFARVERIDYIVGSGQHTNSHVHEENGYLYQVPVTYYTQDGHWSLAPGFANNNARFLRPMRDECVNCHNAKPTFVPGSENRFEHVPEGIDCEQCHGPGSIHVEAIRSGKVVDITKEIDYTIVNPGKLSPELQNDLCSRCHLQAAEVIHPGLAPRDYKPGTPLSTFQNLYWPRQPDSTESFVMAFHPDRMRMSACYTETWAPGSTLWKMTCVSCHNPHEAVDTIDDAHWNAICMSCHVPLQKPCTEPEVAAGRETAACFTCHMPTSGTSDIPHVRITDHYIRVPDQATGRKSPTGEEAKRFLRLANLVEMDPPPANRAEGFMTYYELVTDRPGMLDSASVLLGRARRADPEADFSRSLIRLWFLRGDWPSIRSHVRENPDADLEDAWTLYRVGEAFAQFGETGPALAYVERAVALAPLNVRFLDRLGVLRTEAGDVERAVETFDRLLSLNPKFEQTWTNRGYARLLLGDFAGAEADYRQAMALDPDAELAMAGLASLYLNTGRIEEARALAMELLRRRPGETDYVRLFEAAR